METHQDGDSLAIFVEAGLDLSDTVSLVVGGRYTEDEKTIFHQNCLGPGYTPTCDTVADDANL